MLVLTRKSNQSIMIGDDIEVSVLSVMGEKVRIGIQAPQKVPVFRKEIYLEIHRETGAVTAAQDEHAPRHAPVESSPSVDESLSELGDAG
jgi:carbon storage regulator